MTGDEITPLAEVEYLAGKGTAAQRQQFEQDAAIAERDAEVSKREIARIAAYKAKIAAYVAQGMSEAEAGAAIESAGKVAVLRSLRKMYPKGGKKLDATEVLNHGHRPLIFGSPDKRLPRTGERGPAPKGTEQEDSTAHRSKAVHEFGFVPLVLPLDGAAERRALGDETTELIHQALATIPSKTPKHKLVSAIFNWLDKNHKQLLSRSTIEDHLDKLGLRKRRTKTPSD